MSEHHITDTEYGTGHKTLKSYLIGFSLCLLLTFIPFALVANHLLNDFALYVSLTALAIAQLYVQVLFFLRLNTSRKGRWNLGSFLFTVLVILILVFGSLWIMYNLNYNMVH